MARTNCRLRFSLLLLLGLLNPQLNAQSARKTARLSIMVTDRTNAYVAGAQIKVCPHGGRLPTNPQTNQPVKLQSELDPGDYDLFVTSPAFKPWSKRIQLREESDETVTAVLEVTARTLVRTGHGGLDPAPPAAEWLDIDVSDEAGVPVAFAQLLGLDDLGERRNFGIMDVNEKGELRLKVVPMTYLIAATSPGYERWEKRVEVGVDAEHSLKIVLKRLLIPQIAP